MTGRLLASNPEIALEDTLRNRLNLAIASVVMVDGAVSLVMGPRFITWLQRLTPRPVRPALGVFLLLPAPLFRAGAAVQTMLGGYLVFTRLLARRR